MPSDEIVLLTWGGSLVIALAVVGVVAVLLWLVLRTAGEIEEVASDIWTAGQRVANNTVHIPLLATTNRLVGQVAERAAAIGAVVERIETHANGCPGCPACVVGSARGAP